MESDGGILVSDPAGKAAIRTYFLTESSLGMLLTALFPVITGPSFTLLPLGPVRFKGCLSELDPYGGVDPLTFSRMFFRELVSVLAPKLSIEFRRLLHVGLFPSQWCCADF